MEDGSSEKNNRVAPSDAFCDPFLVAVAFLVVGCLAVGVLDFPLTFLGDFFTAGAFFAGAVRERARQHFAPVSTVNEHERVGFNHTYSKLCQFQVRFTHNCTISVNVAVKTD